MCTEKVYVLVQYPKQAAPKVVYSRAVDGDQRQLWIDTANLLCAKLKESRNEAPLITVYGPKGAFPEEMMAHRWKASPPEVDIFHFGNLCMI